MAEKVKVPKKRRIPRARMAQVQSSIDRLLASPSMENEGMFDVRRSLYDAWGQLQEAIDSDQP